MPLRPGANHTDPRHPKEPQTWCAELADVWVLDCPLLGRNRRTHVSQGLHSDSSGGQVPFISAGSVDLVEQKGAGRLPLRPPAWNPQCLWVAEMRYDRRTKNQQQKLLPGHKQGARRDEPEQSVHLSLLLMPTHAVRCCLLVVTITGAPGTACTARAPMPHHATSRHATPRSSIDSPVTQRCQKRHAQLRHGPRFAKLTVEAALKAALFLITT